MQKATCIIRGKFECFSSSAAATVSYRRCTAVQWVMTGATRSSPGQWRAYARRLIERTPQASWAELDVATQLCEHFGDVPDDAMNDVIEIGALMNAI